MNLFTEMSATIEQFDLLIQLAEEHLEYMRGTVYEGYAESLLEAVISEKEEYIATIEHSN